MTLPLIVRRSSMSALVLSLQISCGSGAASREPYTPVAPPPSNPVCAAPVRLVDTSSPRAVVGSGTPASCTEAALANAIAGGGIITFDCGPDPVTIAISSEKIVASDTVLDGGGRVTLDGEGRTRILAVRSSYDSPAPHLVVQRLEFVRGVGIGNDTSGGGGAIFRLGGTLTVLDSVFLDNECPRSGQDVAGGAISSIGGGNTVVVGSRFARNVGSNGGALGNLGNGLTVVDSSFVQNRATGTGGNPGNGGNGGAIVVDGRGNEVSVCGTIIESNAGNAYGGGFFRVGYDREATHFDRCTIAGNAIPDQAASLGGGLYLQGVTARVIASTIRNNSARGAGGVFLGPGTSVEIVNVTAAENVALSSLGGGVMVDASVSGTLRNVTLVRNEAPGPAAFAAAIAGGSPALVLANTIIAYSRAGNGWNPVSCNERLGDGGGNVQYPVLRAGGGSDDPSALCAAGALVADPLLGPLLDNGGPTATSAPAPASPAIGLGGSCPEFDQRGVARRSPCTSGAYEAP